MKIAVIGAGAMGSLFGAYLHSGGNEVTLVDVWADHVENINRNGLVVYREDGPATFRVPAVTDPGALGVMDLVIIFVKSYHTADAVRNAKNLFADGTLVLTLQNGMGNAEVITSEAGNVTVIAGTTSHGGTVLAPGRVRHAGRGETVIGAVSGPGSPGAVAAEFSRCGIETRVSDNISSLLWGKLLVNVGINPLTAILGVTNGRLVEMESTLDLMGLLVEEGEAVARALGVDLPYPDALGKVRSIALATGENRSSMLQDMDYRRPTEIDHINGAVVREGKKAGVPTPYNRMVSLMIRAVEEKRKLGL